MDFVNRKGKSIIDFPNNYIVLDLETTGYDFRYDDIIEIGALKVENDIIIDNFHTLVSPLYIIDDFITELTGITPQMLKDAPVVCDVMDRLLDFIGDLPIVGHNISFDVNFICYNTERIVNNNYIDTLRLSRRLHPELKHHRLCDMVEFYDIQSFGSHRSLADCKNTFELYICCKSEILTRFDSFDDFKSKYYKKRKRHSSKQINIKSIVPVNQQIDESNPLYDKVCVFTGTLEKMKRADAMQLVVDIGGQVSNGVTKNTNYLILGNNDYCKTIKNGKSNKQKKAEQLKLNGQDIEILSEQVFYEMLDL